MTFPNPRVTDSGVPEVEQEFDAEIAAHTARLEADCLKPLPAIISRDKDGFTIVDRERLDALHADLDAARRPVAPTEERTEGSHTRHEVLADLRRLDAVITDYASARVAVVNAPNSVDSDAAFKQANALNQTITGLLDRIEAWVRGQS
jgi:hypothetical protein